MDAFISWLLVFTFCGCVIGICFSVLKIIKELRHDREWAPPGDPRPRWYTNRVVRREIGTVFFLSGLLLIEVAGYFIVLHNHPLRSDSVFWLLIPICLLNALYRVYTAISEEYERRQTKRLAGETPGRWRTGFKFHRELALAMFWLSIALPWFLINWSVVRNTFREPGEFALWLTATGIGLSGLYLVGTYVLEFFQAYRRSGWTAADQVAAEAHSPLTESAPRDNEQRLD